MDLYVSVFTTLITWYIIPLFVFVVDAFEIYTHVYGAQTFEYSWQINDTVALVCTTTNINIMVGKQAT